MEYKSISTIARLSSGIMLLLALGSWPYSYYQLLRIVVCAASFFLVWYFITIKIEWLGWLFVIPGLLFNPLFPVYLDRSIWQMLDVIFSMLFLGSIAVNQKDT